MAGLDKPQALLLAEPNQCKEDTGAKSCDPFFTSSLLEPAHSTSPQTDGI